MKNRNKTMAKNTIAVLLFLLIILNPRVYSQSKKYDLAKPFTRWWWMGSSVNEEEITKHLIAFQKAGLGGVEITPIYGVKGDEAHFIEFLSERYLQILKHTTRVADSLGLAVDMVLGTGWPYGGSHVDTSFAASKLVVDTMRFKKNDVIDLVLTSKESKIPVAVLAVGLPEFYADLWENIENGRLKWSAPQDVKLYILYSGKTGQMVKRAAPGGAGFTVDHYSREAFDDYLLPFTEKLNMPIRAIFNDSYEVYNTDFTPKLLEEFSKRRGYDLRPYMPKLIDKLDGSTINKVRCDYRETISDLFLENFNRPWSAWAQSKGFVTRLQAHGSPGNLLDMYASADIPECETFGSMPFNIPGFRRELEDIRSGDADKVMLKFSSSAAHMTGKNLVSSESFTWLRDHFKVALSQTKPELEMLLLSGVNHLFLHGSTYSPSSAEWPGWKFYASTNFAPQMNIWKDAPALFEYIKNCQTILQQGSPGNEIAVYYPMHDLWSEYQDGSLFTPFQIHSLDKWLVGRPFYKSCNQLMDAGYGVDFFSDRFLESARYEKGYIVFGKAKYSSLVISATQYMPLETLTKLTELKKQGAKIYFEGIPNSIPGMGQKPDDDVKFRSLVKSLIRSNDVLSQLQKEGIKPAMLASTGLKFITRNTPEGKVYFIANHTSQNFDGEIVLNVKAGKIVLYDAETGAKGKAPFKLTGNMTKVRLQLKAGKTIFIFTGKGNTPSKWKYTRKLEQPLVLSGPYDLHIPAQDGGQNRSYKMDNLQSWTALDSISEAFSGTATYEIHFKAPKIAADAWLLDLPDVRESARVWLNGKYLGTLWANPFEIILPSLQENNVLKLEVSNLDANRIRALEKSGKEWKIFHEINMVNKDYKPFDAKVWAPMPSGIIGEIKIFPVKYE